MTVCVLVVLKYGGIFPATELSVTIATLFALALSALMLGFVVRVGNAFRSSLHFSARFLVSAFFTKANLATLCGILVYFISYLPFILVMFLEAKMTLIHKLLIVSHRSKRDGMLSLIFCRCQEFIQCHRVRLRIGLPDAFRVPGRRCSLEYDLHQCVSERSDEFRHCLRDDAGGLRHLWSHWNLCSRRRACQRWTTETVLVSLSPVDVVCVQEESKVRFRTAIRISYRT